MFKLIKKLGQLLVRMYNVEAKRMNDEARKEAAQSRALSIRSSELADSASTKVTEAARVANQAQQLSKFFE
ncbi:hypothetical protein [Escherichia phage vB_EcoP_PHB19]|uniref:Uncharacterized protein n=1 Tax=Escherichia phage vB_EcoP_PHB19 TaxID=2698729 RepID=A0A6B9RHT8_9CAUD|nr:hypothetical protein [Escherichia phage vB_EcoP_PHB19]